MSHSSPMGISVEDQNWWQERWRSAVYTGVVLGSIAILLWLNALDVRQGWVRLLYGAVACWLLSFFLARSYRNWKFQQLNRNRLDASPAFRRTTTAVDFILFGLLWMLLLEAAARALPPQSNSSISYPGHRFVWPERYAARNSIGLLDHEPAGKKQGQRILVLGDSYVEGAGVRIPERFCSRLQSLLQKSQPGSEVIAAGVGGWSTRDEADFLERQGRQLAPDVVIVSYVLNDAEAGDTLLQRPGRWELWLQTKLNSYLCYRLFRLRRGGFEHYWPAVRRQHSADSQSWRTVEQSLGRIANWCQQEKIPCHLIVQPIFARDADAVRDVMDFVTTRAASSGFVSRNTLDDFDGRLPDFAVSPADAHPNAAAHERIAQQLILQLQRLPGK